MSPFTARVSRALRLSVERIQGDRFRVAGGARTHLVTYSDRRPYSAGCDCEAARFGTAPCKHALAVLFATRLPADITAALRELCPLPPTPTHREATEPGAPCLSRP